MEDHCNEGWAARHWGDVVGMLLLFTGISLEVFHSIVLLKYSFDMRGIHELSTGLVMTGLSVIKLRHNPNKNGNGNGQVETK